MERLDCNDIVKTIYNNYGSRIAAVFCLTEAYKYLQSENPDDIEKAICYFKYIEKSLFSSINGSNTIRLYRDVKEMIKKYDKG